MKKIASYLLGLILFFNFIISSAHSGNFLDTLGQIAPAESSGQEIWISKKLNKSWKTPLEYIIFENKEVKNGLFFPDGLVISDCEDIFSKDYICKSLTNIRKGSFSIDGDYGEFKLRNTGRYP